MWKQNKWMKRWVVVVSILLVFTGCAKIRDMIGRTKGSLVGENYVISFYDNYGSKTLEVEGKRVDVGVFEEDGKLFKSEEETGSFPSQVLEITIDRNQMLQVGNTVVFAEKGLDMVEEFTLPENIETDSFLGFMNIDRYINNLQNQFGKEKVIIVSSQMGVPIGVYQGNNVYVSVPEDLPKMTRIHIDGKSLYIHRANYVVLDSDMLK